MLSAPSQISAPPQFSAPFKASDFSKCPRALNRKNTVSGRKDFLWTEKVKSVENKWIKRHIRDIIKLPYIKKTNLTENVRANSIKGEEKSSNAYKCQIHKKIKHIRYRKKLSYIQKVNSTENEGAKAYEGREELRYI